MTNEQFKGYWLQLKGGIKQKWGDLTDDDLRKIDGDLDRLSGLLLQKYGLAKDHVQRELDGIVRAKASGGELK